MSHSIDFGVDAAIRGAANAWSVDYAILFALAFYESSFDPIADGDWVDPYQYASLPVIPQISWEELKEHRYDSANNRVAASHGLYQFHIAGAGYNMSLGAMHSPEISSSVAAEKMRWAIDRYQDVYRAMLYWNWPAAAEDLGNNPLSFPYVQNVRSYYEHFVVSPPTVYGAPAPPPGPPPPSPTPGPTPPPGVTLPPVGGQAKLRLDMTIEGPLIVNNVWNLILLVEIEGEWVDGLWLNAHGTIIERSDVVQASHGWGWTEPGIWDTWSLQVDLGSRGPGKFSVEFDLKTKEAGRGLLEVFVGANNADATLIGRTLTIEEPGGIVIPDAPEELESSSSWQRFRGSWQSLAERMQRFARGE